MKGFKIGFLYDLSTDTEKKKALQDLIPNKKLYKKHQCYYGLNKEDFDVPIFTKENGVIYVAVAYKGFKFMPFYGKIIASMI